MGLDVMRLPFGLWRGVCGLRVGCGFGLGGGLVVGQEGVLLFENLQYLDKGRVVYGTSLHSVGGGLLIL